MILLLSVFVKEKQENKTKNGRVDSEEHREKEMILSKRSNSLLGIIGFKVLRLKSDTNLYGRSDSNSTLHLILSHTSYNSRQIIFCVTFFILFGLKM